MANNNIYGENRKLKQQTITLQTDENGEITSKSEVNVFNLDKEPNYVKMYFADMLYLKDMPRGLNPILQVFLKNIQWGSNKLILNSSLKKQMAEEIGLKPNTIDKALSQFVKAEILIREAKGIFKFNPFLFGCGNWEDIKQIRTTITYNLNGRTFQSNFESKAENEQ